MVVVVVVLVVVVVVIVYLVEVFVYDSYYSFLFMDCLTPYVDPVKGPLPCGKCISCLQRRTSDWSVRLRQEFSRSTSCYFVTLTYSEDTVPRVRINNDMVNVLCKRDLQLFMKRLRKEIEPARIRFFACGEYGPNTLRPHYHMILFNFPSSKDVFNTINTKWIKGFTTVAQVKPAHFDYVAKYCSSYMYLPEYLRCKSYRPFILCSRRPAIGSCYLSDAIVDYHRRTLSISLVSRDGTKRNLPKYYRDRIFDDQMKADISASTTEFRNQRVAQYIEKYGHRDTVSFYSGAPTIDQQRKIDYARLERKLFKNKRKL